MVPHETQTTIPSVKTFYLTYANAINSCWTFLQFAERKKLESHVMLTQAIKTNISTLICF